MVRGVNGNVSDPTILTLVMPLIRIEGPDDPRIATYQDVSDSELLRHRGLFVAEGRLVVQRVIEDPRFSLHSLLMNDISYRALSGALASGQSARSMLFLHQSTSSPYILPTRISGVS